MHISTSLAFEYDGDDQWSMLYTQLKPLVRAWIYDTSFPSWEGDEEAIAEDIVAMAVIHIYEHTKKVRAHQAKPIVSMSAFAWRTARNCYFDQMRKDRKKVRLSLLIDENEKPAPGNNLLSMEETVHETLFKEQLFGVIAHEIKRFPRKQREAILKDHARLIESMSDPASLLRAYHDAGIHLLDYRSQEPIKKDERSRHSSLLYHAYQRLSQLPSVRKFI